MDDRGNGKRRTRVVGAVVGAGGLVAAAATGVGIWSGHVGDTTSSTSGSSSSGTSSSGTSSSSGSTSSGSTGVMQGTTGSDATTTGS